MSSADEVFSLRLSDSDSENQTRQKIAPSPVFGRNKNKKHVKRVVRYPARARNKLRRKSAGKAHDEKPSNKVFPAKREIQMNISSNCLSKLDVLKISILSTDNDDTGNKVTESPRRQSSTETSETDDHEHESIQTESITVKNKDYSTKNLRKNITEISNVNNSQIFRQLNYSSSYSSYSSEELLGFENKLDVVYTKKCNRSKLSSENYECIKNNNKQPSKKKIPKVISPCRSPQSSDCSDSSTEFLEFEKLFDRDEISDSSITSIHFSHSSENEDNNISNEKRQDLKKTTTSSKKNWPANQNYASSIFESIKKKKQNIPISYSSDSSTAFLNFEKPTTLTQKKKRSSSSEESASSSSCGRTQRMRINKKKKRRKSFKKIRTCSSSDSEENSRIPSKGSNCNNSSSSEQSFSSMNSDKSDVNVSRSEQPRFSKSREEKLRKLRKYFKTIGIDVAKPRHKDFWTDCKLYMNKILKKIKIINSTLDEPIEIKWEIGMYLEFLQLNSRDIISLNERVTRSQTANQRWQHYLKYGSTVKSILNI